MASKFTKNLRTRNMELLLWIVEKLSRPGVHAECTFSVIDGEIGKHQRITMKLEPPQDDLREKDAGHTLDDLVSVTAE